MATDTRREIARHLHEKVVAYWHDVDFNWGRNASDHYTPDGVFLGSSVRYDGRAEIQEFYNWRQDRGERTNVHLVGNFHVEFDGDDTATAAWICTLYAKDGAPPQESAPPISITRVVDTFVRQPDGEWLCAKRHWHGLFKGGVPATSLTRDEMNSRMDASR